MAEEQRGRRDACAINPEPARAELAEWRATCRRQAAAIEALTRVVGRLRSGLTALKAENAELRAGALYERSIGPVTAMVEPGPSVEARVALGLHAPATARRLVTRMLEHQVRREVLERAKLVISELVTNSVCHGVPTETGYATVRLSLANDLLRLEVEDPGGGGTVALRTADARTGEGFGLQIVESVSERWGTERSAGGSTRVWAELSVSTTIKHANGRVRHAATGSERDRTGQRRRTPGETARGLRHSGEVHVVPLPRAGTWALFVDSVAGALSEHTTHTAAESAGRDEAMRRGCERIVVHDRYHRTRAETLPAIQ